jgi:hypothetical protein
MEVIWIGLPSRSPQISIFKSVSKAEYCYYLSNFKVNSKTKMSKEWKKFIVQKENDLKFTMELDKKKKFDGLKKTQAN